MQNLISVIVTTYNQESTIGRTLDSILMQECHVPVEIVIGEDYSTDGTLKVCQEYKEKYPDKILLLANNPNKGIVDNYFDCIFAAHGKYIADCAGDDYWIDSLKLEKEVTVLEEHSEVGIVHTDWQRVETPHKPTASPPATFCPSTKVPRREGASLFEKKEYLKSLLQSKRLPPYGGGRGERLLITPSPRAFTEQFICDGKALLEEILVPTHRPLIHLCTSLYRTEWIRKAHDENLEFFRNKEYGCEDVQVAFYMAKMGSVAYLKDITLNYSWGGESISNSADYERLFRFFKRAAQLTHDIAKKEHMMTPKVTAYLQQKVFELQMDSFRTHNREMRDEANSLIKKWEITDTKKTRLMRLLMSNPLTWNLALMIRNFVVAMK